MPTRRCGALSRLKRILESFVLLIFDLLFRFVCSGKHECIPPITDLQLLDSAKASALKIRSGKLKSRTLVEAYISRVADVEPFINAVANSRYEAALEEAAAIDKLLEIQDHDKKTWASQKPLLGVPFTVSGALSVKGLPHHCGLYTCRNTVAEKNAVTVDMLLHAGAVPIATTSVPELCLGTETSNSICGCTYNPHDLIRSPGGCGGGEAALLASAGSVIGLCSDMMGEARLAAAYCGVFAHKPTSGLVSNVGHFLEFPRELDKLRCVAPMCRYATDLAIVLQTIAGSGGQYLKLSEEVCLQHLKCFFLDESHSLVPHLTGVEQIRAVQKVLMHIEQVHGVKAKKLHLPGLEHGFGLWRSKYARSRGVPWVTRALGHFTANLSAWTELILVMLGISYHTLTSVLASIWDDNLDIISEDIEEECTLCDDMAHILQTTLGDDGVLVLPGPPHPASCRLQSIVMGTKPFGMLSPFNVVGCPVTVCPVEGASIQVVAAKGKDRLCLAIANELERGFGGWQSPALIC